MESAPNPAADPIAVENTLPERVGGPSPKEKHQPPNPKIQQR